MGDELQEGPSCAVAASGYEMIDGMKERQRVAEVGAALKRLDAMPRGGKTQAFAAAAAALRMSAGRLHNVYTEWKAAKRRGDENGMVLAIADGRRLARGGGRRSPWVSIYMKYCENDRNTDMGGWEAMKRDFLSGALVVPGVGNWLQAWQRENRGLPVEWLRNPLTGRIEPPEGWMPRGATQKNLAVYAAKDPTRCFALAFARQGRKAAHRHLLPVLQSRVGVTVGEITQFDDVWLNDDIIVDGRVCRPLAFVGYDYASAFQCACAMKPRVPAADGGRMQNLKEYDFRCTLANHCVRTGFWAKRAMFVLEHGTTAIRDDKVTDVRKNIMAAAEAHGWHIELRESGILSEQAHGGLFKGVGGGNFRMKALCEGSHNIVHNRLASLPGSRGRDAEHLHESQPALVKYEQELLDAAKTMDPIFAAKLQHGLQTFEEYEAEYHRLVGEVMQSHGHRLEGWNGRMVRKIFVMGRWQSVDEFASDHAPEDMALMAAAARSNPKLLKDMPMSRLEVWEDGVKRLTARGEWAKFPAIDMPAFFTFKPRAGRPHGDFVELRVRDNGLVGLRDSFYFGRDELLYRAVVKDRRGYSSALPPGRKVLLLVNPLVTEVAVLLNPETRDVMGVAQRYDRAPAYDRRAIEVAMGEQARDLARKVLPIRGRHQDEAERRARRMAANLRVLAAAKEAAARGPEPDGEGYALDDLNGAAIREDPADGAAGDGENADALAFLDAANAV